MTKDRFDRAERHLDELSEVSDRLDPVPPAALEAAIAAFSWRTIDAELADLVFDSSAQAGELVGIRSSHANRHLTFEAPHLVVELELDDDADFPVVGQLVPMGPAEVEVCYPGGSVSAQADERGRFWVSEVAGRIVSLRIRRADTGVDWITTPWVSLVSASA